MEKVIARAIDSINQILKLSESLNDHKKARLIQISNVLNRLTERDSRRNSWTYLFCRQLNRLMDYNDSLSVYFWFERYSDILYAANGPNGGQNSSTSWERFLGRIDFESKLEQREIQFQRGFGVQKSFTQLYREHRGFLEEYLQNCASFHSKIQLQGLADNLDDFLTEVYRLTEVSLNSENQKYLKKNLECIEMAFDCLDRSLQRCYPSHTTYDNSYKRVNDNFSSFIPSAQQTPVIAGRQFEKIPDALKYHRWLVILSHPGSAKTTLLRWIARVFAETILRGDEEVVLEEDSRLPVRIPILIRIGEFADWLVQHPAKTLIDYIGAHTWFSNRYCHDEGENVLKESIHHGHALILLDGLDEVSEFGRREEIVDLVKKFVDEYALTPDFISPFDSTIFNHNTVSAHEEVVEMQPPSKSGGNQIIVMSRIIGYELYPLISSLIQHYTLLLMNHKEATKFVEKWMLQVEKSVLNVLANEGIELNEETVRALSNKRNNAAKAIFENASEFLMSNPSLACSICTFIFQSTEEFHPKCRVEVYNHAVQAAMHFWTSQKSNISESVLINFLVDLATYLHLQSSSGLIDYFDMEQLCCLNLKQQRLSDDRTKLREYTRNLICLLSSSVVIVAERGLQIFGFLHLPLQEYFVMQSLVKESSVNKTVERILTFVINLRFRESLLLAIGWISWKWSFDDYNKFCNLLVTSNKNYAIPFGTLLLFDAFNDLQKFPSESIIFTALNTLLDHSSSIIPQTYLVPTLFRMHKQSIREWMQTELQDESRLLKFCQCLLAGLTSISGTTQTHLKIILPTICQQLWSLHIISTSVEFVIDQTLRGIMTSDNAPQYSFNKELSSYMSLHDICASTIHPLILSVIIAVCGGICLKEEKHILKIHFCQRQMHRESSILTSLVEYFNNHEESHLIKVQTLIKQYESVLQRTSPANTSSNIVDHFIVLICLQGISQPWIYEKYDGHQALPLALDRLKQAWFYLMKSCESFKYSSNISFIKSDIKAIINSFFSQSDEQCSSFSLACAAACKKFRMWNLTKSMNFGNFHDNNASRYLRCQSKHKSDLFYDKLCKMEKNIDLQNNFQQEPFFILTFVPECLQQLYYCMIIAAGDDMSSLPLVLLFSHCLIHLENGSIHDSHVRIALSVLQPFFNEHKLDNYAAALSTRCNKRPSEDWEKLIYVERHRINEAKNVVEDQEKDLRFFSASISLARLFQARYRSQNKRITKHISLCISESREVHLAIKSIFNPILQIIAFSIILDMKDPTIFDEEQRDQFRCTMIDILQSLLPNLSLVVSALLFVRCRTAHQFLPLSFKMMANVIGIKLNETFMDKENQDQEAAYIALRQFHNSDLSNYLSMFEKRTNNLFDLLQFNSTIFHHYFSNTTSFTQNMQPLLSDSNPDSLEFRSGFEDFNGIPSKTVGSRSNPIIGIQQEEFRRISGEFASELYLIHRIPQANIDLHNSLDTVLLSSMYLNELAFDAQILKIYIRDSNRESASILKELNQLWNESSKIEKIMTFKVATWITNYLQMPKKQEVHQILKDVSRCFLIEKKALLIIEQWITYRMDKDLSVFAHYAALQLFIGGSNIPYLMDIIEEMFHGDSWFCLISIVEHLFTAQLINLNIFRQILLTLQRNARYSSRISVYINCRDSLELILNLEFERVSSTVHHPQGTSTRSFFMMIRGCSEDLKLYLKEYLRQLIATPPELDNSIKDEYLAIVVRWIIESSISCEREENFSVELYQYILPLLHDQRFPQIQKAIVNAFNSIFLFAKKNKKNIFLQDDTVINLEKVINSWKIYPKEVVDVCLLAYGNFLIRSNQFEMSRSPSNEIKNILSVLFETSSSDVTSIRAAFCLIFAEDPVINFRTTLNWFQNKWSITSEKRYKIVLQQTLYEAKETSLGRSLEEFVEQLESHSADLMDTFVIDFYHYLCDDNNRNYLSDPSPDYANIATRVSERDWNEFHTAVQKISFGEKEFKTKLSRHFLINPKDRIASIKLYIAFGIVTNELVDMLAWIGDDEKFASFLDWRHLTQIADRDVIEKFFQLFDSKMSDNKFKSCLEILESLTNGHALSLLEVHQRISLIIDKYHHDGDKWSRREQDIFQFLFSLSCFNNQGELLNSKGNFITKDDIDREFGRELEDVKEYDGEIEHLEECDENDEDFDQGLALFLKTDGFLTDFQSIPILNGPI